MKTRPRLSPTVNRFIAGQFFRPFSFSLVAFTGIYLLVDIFDRFDDLMRYGGFNRLGLEYFLLKLPLIVSQLLPVACLAGVLLGFALLNRNGEILALQGLGISRLELAAPVIAVGALLSVFDFVLTETVVPLATRQATHLYSVELKKRHPMGIFAGGIWIRVRDGFLSVDGFDPRRSELFGVTVFHLGPDGTLRDIHKASNATWDGKGWRLNELTILRLSQSGTISVVTDDDFHLDAKPADFNLLRQNPEEFSLAELNHYIHGLRRKGLDPGGYVVDRDLKYALPLACLIMAVLGVSLSLDPIPRNLSLSRSFGIGIGLGFSYWLALGFTSSFGRSGLIPAWLAAWLPNATFTILAVSIFLFGEER
jgi:lipopolysaccharide export system permease protein